MPQVPLAHVAPNNDVAPDVHHHINHDPPEAFPFAHLLGAPAVGMPAAPAAAAPAAPVFAFAHLVGAPAPAPAAANAEADPDAPAPVPRPEADRHIDVAFAKDNCFELSLLAQDGKDLKMIQPVMNGIERTCKCMFTAPCRRLSYEATKQLRKAAKLVKPLDYKDCPDELKDAIKDIFAGTNLELIKILIVFEKHAWWDEQENDFAIHVHIAMECSNNIPIKKLVTSLRKDYGLAGWATIWTKQFNERQNHGFGSGFEGYCKYLCSPSKTKQPYFMDPNPYTWNAEGYFFNLDVQLAVSGAARGEHAVTKRQGMSNSDIMDVMKAKGMNDGIDFILYAREQRLKYGCNAAFEAIMKPFNNKSIYERASQAKLFLEADVKVLRAASGFIFPLDTPVFLLPTFHNCLDMAGWVRFGHGRIIAGIHVDAKILFLGGFTRAGKSCFAKALAASLNGRVWRFNKPEDLKRAGKGAIVPGDWILFDEIVPEHFKTSADIKNFCDRSEDNHIDGRFESSYIPEGVTIVCTTNAFSMLEWFQSAMRTAAQRDKMGTVAGDLPAIEAKAYFHVVNYCLSKDMAVKEKFMRLNCLDERAKPFPHHMEAENAEWFARNNHWLEPWKIVKQAEKERAENLLNPRKRRRVNPQGQGPNPAPAQGQGQGQGMPNMNDPQFMMFAQNLWQQMNGQQAGQQFGAQNQFNGFGQGHNNFNNMAFGHAEPQGCPFCGKPAGQCYHCYECGTQHASVPDAIRCRECGCPDDLLD